MSSKKLAPSDNDEEGEGDIDNMSVNKLAKAARKKAKRDKRKEEQCIADEQQSEETNSNEDLDPNNLEKEFERALEEGKEEMIEEQIEEEVERRIKERLKEKERDKEKEKTNGKAQCTEIHLEVKEEEATNKILTLRELNIIEKGIPAFKGEKGENVVEFLRQLNDALDGFEITEKALCRLIRSKLQGTALRWFTNTIFSRPKEKIKSKKLLKMLREEYLNKKMRVYASTRLRKLVAEGQGKMDVDAFYSAYCCLAEVAVPVKKKTKVMDFISALSPEIQMGMLNVEIIQGQFKTLTSAHDYARQLEQNIQGAEEAKEKLEEVKRKNNQSKREQDVHTAETDIEKDEKIIRLQRDIQRARSQLADERSYRGYVIHFCFQCACYVKKGEIEIRRG